MGQVYYILGTRNDFSEAGLWEPRIPTDHRIVQGVLCGIWSQVVTHTSRSVPLDLSKRIRQAEGALHFRDQKKKNKKPSRKDILTTTP